MSGKKLSDVIKSASAVNLKYSANLLNLGREYVSAFTDAMQETLDDEVEGAPGPAAQARPPLLLAGRAGEMANAAFTMTSSSGPGGKVTLKAVGDFGDTKVSIDPADVTIENGKEVLARVMAKIGRKMPAGVDHVGAVMCEELDSKIADFVIRKIAE
ncbi:MAG: hypothetical protein AAF557_18765 [Pseudomonadota bacterium]